MPNSDGKAAKAAATGSLVKTGSGTQTFADTAANTYSGGSTVKSGTLSGNAGSYGSGNITVNSGAAVDYTQGGTAGTAANNISGTGTVTFGGNTSSANGTGGTVNYTGQDGVATTVQSGTVNLNHAGGAALAGPVAVATSGVAQLAADNQVQTNTQGTASNVALNGGTLNANGHSDGSANLTDPTSSAVTSHMGTLSLGDRTMSTLDFGLGSNIILAFADSLASLQVSGAVNNGTLNILNYTGSGNALYIGTTKDLSQNELDRIIFNGLAANQLAKGQVVAAPEPSSLLSLLIGGGFLGGFVIRKRRNIGGRMQSATLDA